MASVLVVVALSAPNTAVNELAETSKPAKGVIVPIPRLPFNVSIFTIGVEPSDFVICIAVVVSLDGAILKTRNNSVNVVFNKLISSPKI